MVGRFFVACVDALPPILDKPKMRFVSPVASKLSVPTLFMPETNRARSSLIFTRLSVPVVALIPPNLDNAFATLVTPSAFTPCIELMPAERFFIAEEIP